MAAELGGVHALDGGDAIAVIALFMYHPFGIVQSTNKRVVV